MLGYLGGTSIEEGKVRAGHVHEMFTKLPPVEILS